MDTETIKSSESIRRWVSSRAAFWHSHSRPRDRRAEEEALIATLGEFCDLVGKGPDALIDACLEPAKEGQGLMLRIRARREMIEQIEGFEAEKGRDAANVVRSFFIHNGVAMNPGILT
jgi:hypothetical protein